MVDKVEQTVSEYAWLCMKRAHARARYSQIRASADRWSGG
jgi:hypothetical protein